MILFCIKEKQFFPKGTPFDEGGHQNILVIGRYHISYEPDMNAESGNNNTSAYTTTAELNIAYSAAIYDSEYIGSFFSISHGNRQPKLFIRYLLGAGSKGKHLHQ